MYRYTKFLLILVCFLFAKDLALVISFTDNPLYWMENVEEHEQGGDTKEKEDKKEPDNNKFKVEVYQITSAHLSSAALHIVSERKYSAPSFDIVVPPPEQV